MTSVATAWNQFKQRVLTPYWCEGSPLAWWHTEARIGIAHFAMNGDVGKFNLAWWLVNRSQPPLDAKVYVNTPLRWVVMQAPAVRFGRDSLADIASYCSLAEWQAFVRKAPVHRLLGNGLTLEHLQHLVKEV